MKTTRILYLSLCLIAFAACGSSSSDGPSTVVGGQGGTTAGQGGGTTAGTGGTAAGQGGTAAGQGGSTEEGGSGGGELKEAQTLCEGACNRIAACTGEITYTVDLPACTAQCVKEVTGEGSLIQEIAVQFYVGMKDSAEGCDYPRDGLSPYWNSFYSEPEQIKKLKEYNEIILPCVEMLWDCYYGEKDSYEPGCFRHYYRYNTERRQSIKECFAKPCPDRNYCTGEQSPKSQIWIDGIVESGSEEE